MKEIASWHKPARSKWPSDLTENVRFTGGVNLRGPILDGGWFTRATLSNCSFEGCDLGSPLFTKMDMNQCRFDSVKFGTNVAVWKDVHCNDCTFNCSALAHITFIECKFTNAVISGTNLGDLRFMKCSFDNVMTTDVRAHEVSFVENVFVKTSFSGATMADCSLVNCRLGDSTWPNREECFLVMPQQISVVANAGEGKIHGDDRQKLAHLESVFVKSKDPIIWDESLIEELSPNARVFVMRELFALRLRQTR